MPCVLPFCVDCKHFNEAIENTYTCDAFENEIPSDYFGGNVNVKELKECSNGIGYEEAPQETGKTAE